MSIENGDSAPYWEGARRGVLRFQHCAYCGGAQFPPRNVCAICWSPNLVWVDASGRGSVESYTVVHRAPTAALRGKVPYVVVAVRTEEGPRMITNLVGDDARDVAPGDAVEAVFEDDGQGRILPQFRRAAAAP